MFTGPAFCASSRCLLAVIQFPKELNVLPVMPMFIGLRPKGPSSAAQGKHLKNPRMRGSLDFFCILFFIKKEKYEASLLPSHQGKSKTLPSLPHKNFDKKF
jgi:hypothetical protein